MSIKNIVIVALFVLLGAIGKKYFFPDDVDIIKGKLIELSTLLSKSKGESVLEVANKVKKSLDYFSPPLEIKVNFGVQWNKTIGAQDKIKIKESIALTKFKYPWLIVKFNDVNIVLQGQGATSTFTARLLFNTSDQGDVYDLFDVVAHWKKSEGNWYIGDINVEKVNLEN